MYNTRENFEDLVGKTITKIATRDDEELFFGVNNGIVYIMSHNQNCCENVYIESIVGDLDDLLGSPILIAEESTNMEENPSDVADFSQGEVYTWTFYKLSTIKGSVTIRRYGDSNGYYSTNVDFQQLNDADSKIFHAKNSTLGDLVFKNNIFGSLND